MHAEKVQAYTLFGLLGITSVLTVLIFRPFLAPIALAAVFGIVLYPVYLRLLGWFGGWRGIAAFVTILLAFLCLLVPISLVGVQVAREMQQTYFSLTQGAGLETTQATVLAIGNGLEGVFPGATQTAQGIAGDLNKYIEQALGWLLGNVGDAASALLGLSIDLVIFIGGLFVFLRNGPAIRKQLIAFSPFSDKDDTRIVDQLILTVNAVVRGALAVALVQGIVAGVGYIIFGVPNPLLWGTLTGIAALVPGIGTALVLLPAIGYLLAVGSIPAALGLLAWGILAVGLIDNLLGPTLMGRGIQLPPLVILLSVLGGVAFFGPAGIFLGPLTVSFLIALFSLHPGRGQPA